jgi:hypothetical protein
MGIIGFIAGAVIIAVSPRKSLLDARDATRKQQANQLEKALLQYLIDKWSLPNDNQISEGAANAKQICRVGVTGDNTCISFDPLVTSDYVTAIPVDPAEPCANYTGYRVYKSSGRVQIEALHLGKMPGEVTGSCSGGSSSSASSVPASSSAASSASASPPPGPPPPSPSPPSSSSSS